MRRLLLERGLAALLNIVLVSLLIFLLVRLAPGNPVDLLLPAEASVQERQELARHWGLDRPLPAQYLAYTANLLRGDLGTSLYFQVPVRRLLWERVPASLELIACALLLIALVATPLGVAAALRPRTAVDHLSAAVAIGGISLPPFWLAILLVLVFGGYLNLLPVSGRATYGVAIAPLTGFQVADAVLAGHWGGLADTLGHLILPAVSLASVGIALFTRLLRSSMLEALRQDYVVTARAKGLSERAVVWKHALRNALIPVLTAWGLAFTFMLSGSVIIETIFAWPGIGRLAVQAIGNRDYPLVQGIALAFVLLVIVAHLAIDVLYALVDPRIRYG
jgi:peptide/nickel transport system permease protein